VIELNPYDKSFAEDPYPTYKRLRDSGGVTIPAGSKTMLLAGAATRDERKFDHPDVFDISRESVAESIYFGFGTHRCLGFHLARLELRIVFGELFRRFPSFEVDSSRATRSVLSNVRGVKTLPARLGRMA
jgi:cytochrome P450